MSLGRGVFIAFLLLGAVCAVIACRHTWRQHGRSVALREAAVLAASLGTYAGICLLLGYSTGAQFLAAALSWIPLRIGRRYLPPSFGDYLGGNR